MNDELKQLEKDLISIAYPEELRSTAESNKFRGIVLDKHTILENLIDLLLAAFFFESANTPLGEKFIEHVLSKMDFAKKATILQDVGLIDKKGSSIIFKVNSYRLAQAHLKKNDPLRNPDKDNDEKFQKISIEAHALVAKKMLFIDKSLKERLMQIVIKDLSKKKEYEKLLGKLEKSD